MHSYSSSFDGFAAPANDDDWPTAFTPLLNEDDLPTFPPSLDEDDHPAVASQLNEDDLVIAVMGASGAGKSTFINKASGSDLGVGEGLFSETRDVNVVSFPYCGRNVVLVDTPGFDDTEISDTDTLKTIANWLEVSYNSDKLLSGIIYLHRITDNRVGGVSARNMKLFQKLCGKEAMQNVVLCTTMWDLVKDNMNVGIAREKQLASVFWKRMIDDGARTDRHYGTVESAQDVIKNLSSLQRVALDIQTSLAEGIPLEETEAGKEIEKALLAAVEKLRCDLQEMKREMAKAIRERDEDTQRLIAEDRAALIAKLTKERLEQDKLVASRTKEIESLQAQISTLKKANNSRSSCIIM